MLNYIQVSEKDFGGFEMPVEYNNQTFYNTAEACKIAGTNKDTFLRWVKLGKFVDVKHRDRNGWRLFTDNDLVRLRTKVNHLQMVGAEHSD
jgi:DNA-binding transcriptional MerR regulator